MKIILVTGGAGFLGNHLCRYLLQNGNYVICVDNLITGNLNNIKDLVNQSNFEYIHFDITTSQFYESLMKISKIDEIYHLASIASPEKYKKYPIETLMTSIIGTKHILELCIHHQCKMLFTSTSEVYGDPLIHPQSEEYYGNVNTVGERSCYDEGKRVAETMIYEYTKKYHLQTKIVRLFNTYGPLMDINDGRVITNFIRQINAGLPLKIYGDGTQTRSFCYVDDMIEGLFKMMESKEYGPINLGNPYCEFTLNELVKNFEKITNKNINVEYLPLTENDPLKRKPVIDKAIQKLNWYPKISLLEGLQKTYQSFL